MYASNDSFTVHGHPPQSLGPVYVVVKRTAWGIGTLPGLQSDSETSVSPWNTCLISDSPPFCVLWDEATPNRVL